MNFTNLNLINLREQIANKRFALECSRTAPYSRYKAPTIKRLSDELRALENQLPR